MKKLIVLFLVSFTATGNYVKLSEVEDGNISKTWTNSESCGTSCVRLPSNYDKIFHVLIDEMVNDISKPIYDKTNMAVCSDISDCDTQMVALVCSGNGYEKIKNYDLLQVYCIKIVGYEKKPSGRKVVVEDATKKSLNDAAILASKNSKKAYRDSLILIRTDIEDGKNLTPAQINEVLNYILKSL